MSNTLFTYQLEARRQDTTLERTGLLPSHPTLCPADVALHLIPGSLPTSATKLLVDCTIIPMMSLQHNDNDPSLSLLSLVIMRNMKI